jgi:hypothetical protein
MAFANFALRKFAAALNVLTTSGFKRSWWVQSHSTRNLFSMAIPD